MIINSPQVIINSPHVIINLWSTSYNKWSTSYNKWSKSYNKWSTSYNNGPQVIIMGSLSNCALWQSWLSCMHTYQMLSAGTYFKVTAASKMDFLGTVLLDQVKTVSSLLVHGQDQADNVI